MQSTVSERFEILVKLFANGNKSAFARLVGVSPQAVHDYVTGRKGEPSFSVISKLSSKFPQLRIEWLLNGSGTMLNEAAEREKALEEEVTLLRKENQGLKEIINRQDVSLPLTSEQWNQAMNAVVAQLHETYSKSPKIEERLVAARANAQADAEALMQNYRISINHPDRRKLSDRLNLTEEEARELVLSGRIRSVYIGPDNDRARRNGASYLIPEWAVREFLQSTSAAPSTEQ